MVVSSCFENGKSYESLLQVRTNGVKAFLDGKLISHWDTDFADASMHRIWTMRDNRLLGLGSFQSPTVFSKIEILEITGNGKPLRQVSGPTTQPSPLLAQRSDRDKPTRVVPAKVSRAPTKKKRLGGKSEPVSTPIIVAGEYKEWRSVLILSNEVMTVKLRYMPIFSAADPFPMALEFDNRSGGPLKVLQIWVQFKTSRSDVERPHVSVPWETVSLWEITNGVNTVTGTALRSPLAAAMELSPKTSVHVSATTGGDVWLQDKRRFYFDKVPFDFEMRYPGPPAIESMKQQLREGLRTELKPHPDPRRKQTAILSDGTPALIDGRSSDESTYRLGLLRMKEIADAMTLDDLLEGLKTGKRDRTSIAEHLGRRFPNAPEVLAYYREELAKERSGVWDEALATGVWNEEFLKAAVARFEKGNFYWAFHILQRHRNEWIGKPDYVARISAALLKQKPVLTSRPRELKDNELYEWSRAVSEAGATGDRQFIKYLAPALDDKRVIREPEESSAPRGFATRACDDALNAILIILDGDSWAAFKKADIQGWSSDRQSFAAHDRVIADTKKRLEASGLLPKEK